MYKISVITVNYYTSNDIRRIIRKLDSQDFEVIIWNNSPSDRIDSFGNVRVFESKLNIGFGPAINRVIKYAKSNYVLLLNPDCDFEVGVVYKMFEFLRSNDDVFAVSPRVLTRNGKIWPSARKLSNPLLFLFSRRSPLGQSKEFLYLDKDDRILEVEALCGTFLMLKKDVFLKLNGFDEMFFFYAEDLDLSLRARKLGYKLFLLNNLVVYHDVGTTRKMKNSFSEYKRAKSLFLFLIKNYMTFKILLPLILFAFLFYLKLLMIRDLFDLKIKDPLWKRIYNP